MSGFIAWHRLHVSPIRRAEPSTFGNRAGFQSGFVVQISEPSGPVVPRVVVSVNLTTDGTVLRFRCRQVVDRRPEFPDRRPRSVTEPVQPSPPLPTPNPIHPVLRR